MGSMSRRSFLKLTGATAVAAAGTAMLSGCGINTVTVIAIMNGEEVNREKTPMPSFMSVDWAINLMRPFLITAMRARYPELGDAANEIEISADPDYPNNGKQVQDENGNWTMVIAVKSNIVTADVKVIGTNLSGVQCNLFTSTPVLTSWTALPDASMQKCVQSFGERYYQTTLSVRPDNGKITWSGTSKASVTIYVENQKKG